MKIICISGKAGHGKDTFAGFLKTRLVTRGKRVLIAHYGDLIKYVCSKFFGWDGKKDEKGRTLLQQIGTEGIRSKKPDYWVSFIADILEMFPDEWDYVLIPDARFPNEVNYLKDKGLDVLHIRVERPGFNMLTDEQQKHKSETALDNFPADLHVDNDGSLCALQSKAEGIAFMLTVDLRDHV